jgi:hypothetical protein
MDHERGEINRTQDRRFAALRVDAEIVISSKPHSRAISFSRGFDGNYLGRAAELAQFLLHAQAVLGSYLSTMPDRISA